MYIAYHEDIKPIYRSYFPIMKAIAGQFGNQCEVVIHDFADYNASIYAMMGNVTGRELYAPLTQFIIQTLQKEGEDAEDKIGYITYFQGKPFRCSTIFIREEGELVGCLCINYSVQEFFALKAITEQLTTSRSVLQLESEAKKEYFARNVEDFVEHTLEDVLTRKEGKDITQLTKDERIEIIRELDATGIFSVKGTVEKLAERMNMSKFTIYNYIEESRK